MYKQYVYHQENIPYLKALKMLVCMIQRVYSTAIIWGCIFPPKDKAITNLSKKNKGNKPRQVEHETGLEYKQILFEEFNSFQKDKKLEISYFFV